MTDGLPRGAVAPLLSDLPESGPQAPVANDVPGTASTDCRGVSAKAAAVLGATSRHWDTTYPLPVPRGDWLACPICGGPWLIRSWRFHVRPGRPTVPWRCDVDMKCAECAHGWWHGIALPFEAYQRRPRPQGLRALLTRGSSFEPAIWNGNRTVRNNAP